MNIHQKHRNFGFTLIELLVVIAIIGILTSIIISTTRNNPDRDAHLEKDRFVAFVRDVQNRTLAMGELPSATGKVCGYGIHVAAGSSTASEYFVQTAGSTPQDEACSTVSKVFVADNELDNFTLSHQMIFDESADTDIFFLAPYGVIYLGETELGGSNSIDIGIGDGEITPIQTIIHSTGLVE